QRERNSPLAEPTPVDNHPRLRRLSSVGTNRLCFPRPDLTHPRGRTFLIRTEEASSEEPGVDWGPCEWPFLSSRSSCSVQCCSLLLPPTCAQFPAPRSRSARPADTAPTRGPCPAGASGCLGESRASAG